MTTKDRDRLFGFDVGDTIIITSGRAGAEQVLRVVAVTQPDKLGRLRTRQSPRRWRAHAPMEPDRDER